MVLAAGGEFAFVVFKLGKDQGLFDTQTYDLLLMTITLSMAITPLLMLGCARALKRPQAAREVPEQYKSIEAGSPRVVIVGMGRMGQIVARILRAQKIPFIALETSVDAIEMTRMFEQAPVFYGDPLRPEVLHAAKVGEAEYFIITSDDPEVTIRTAERVKRLYPHLKVIARARNRQHVHKLMDVGAEPIRETFYSSLEMSRRALVGLGLSDEQAADRIARFTEHDEQVLKPRDGCVTIGPRSCRRPRKRGWNWRDCSSRMWIDLHGEHPLPARSTCSITDVQPPAARTPCWRSSSPTPCCSARA
jgi:glutathione-regulated potassium-efflux system protein KefB